VVPAHVGIILDGNRRWAKEQGMSSLEGHKAGYENVLEIAPAAFAAGVKFLSVFVFSTENWQRSKEEVDYLMRLVGQLFERDVERLRELDIRLRWLGSEQGLSGSIRQRIAAAEQRTAHGQSGQLLLCFNYGGQLEIAEAASRAAAEGDVTPDTISQHLYAPDVPPLDLIIRTSGEQRLSNFMLWRAAYAEFSFSPKFWPSFNSADLQAALTEYANRQRRFGR
jgi:undecaprenyl diphosphate synthase